MHSVRTLAHYDGRVVLLDWKNAQGPDDTSIGKRVNQVAALLQELGPSFHSLSCKGYVKDYQLNRYKYIFELPEGLCVAPANSTRSANLSSPELKVLCQMFEESTTPSLNARLLLAMTLLENFLNLHTSGWLHKDFLQKLSFYFARGMRSCHKVMASYRTTRFYVAGYVCSRADGPGEMTEPLKSDVESDYLVFKAEVLLETLSCL